MERVIKQPAEAFTIAVDFSANFTTGETIIAQSVTATNKLGTDVTEALIAAGTVSNDGKGKVVAIVTGGENGQSPYKLTFLCETSNGHTWEMDIKLVVREL